MKLPQPCPQCKAPIMNYGMVCAACGYRPATTLRDRCKEMCQSMSTNAMLRQGSPVDDLMAFVIAETGRSADQSLEETLPLCLYFGNKEDREEFIAVMREARPGMTMKKLP